MNTAVGSFENQIAGFNVEPFKKDTKVRVTYRPELGTGAVLQVAEALDGYTQVDVVFEKDGKRFLETFPQSLVTPVADIFHHGL